MSDLITKDDLLNALRSYSITPDDDNVRFKEKIKDALLTCPELLYAINEKDLESELFIEYDDDDGKKQIDINWDGDWDKYFSDSTRDGNIRPYLFIPETQTDVKHYVCYQTHFEEAPRYNAAEKYALITFTIFVHGEDRIDVLTGIPRHDLIGSIIRDKINWSNLFGTQCHLVSNKESVTDNNYVVRTMTFRVTNVNNIVKTVDGKTFNENTGKYESVKRTLMINKLGGV